MDQSPDFLAQDGSFYITALVQVEDQDGHVIVFAQRDGRRIHDR
jgi:hypothetical protein